MSKKRDYPSTDISVRDIAEILVPAYTNVEIQGVLTLALRRLRHEPFSIEYVLPLEDIKRMAKTSQALKDKESEDHPAPKRRKGDNGQSLSQARADILSDWLGEPREQKDILSGKMVASYTRFSTVKDPMLIDIFREFFIDALIHCWSINFCPFYAVKHPDYEFNKIPVIPETGKWSCRRFTDNRRVWWEFKDLIDDTTIQNFPTMITIGRMIPFASSNTSNLKGFTGTIAVAMKSLSEMVEHREALSLGARKAANPTIGSESIANDREAQEEIERRGGGSVNEDADKTRESRLAKKQEMQDKAARDRARELNNAEADEAQEDMLIQAIAEQEEVGYTTGYDGVPSYSHKFANPSGGSRAALRNPTRSLDNGRKFASVPTSTISSVSVECVERLLEGIARLLSIPLDRLRGTGAKLSADVQTAASEMNETYEAVLTHVRKIANAVMPFVDEESYEFFKLAGVKPDVIVRMNSTAPSIETMKTYLEFDLIRPDKATELIATQHNWPSTFMKEPKRDVCDMVYPEKPEPVMGGK